MLDLRRLRLLRELHERGTIAAVADALRFTPSAVSQQLAMLERETGVTLLEHRELLRHGRRAPVHPVGDGRDRAPLVQLSQQPQAAEVEHREAMLLNSG